MSSNKEKRYVLNLDMYLYARNDREAMVKAARIAEFLDKEKGGDVSTTHLLESPFASLSTRSVHEGTLSIFENKLLPSTPNPKNID